MNREFGGVMGLANQLPGLDMGLGADVPWLPDWSAYQTTYSLTGAAVSVAASTWNTFVNVSGKGFFKWCRISDDSNAFSANPAIRITVDGVVYQFDSALAGTYSQGNEINFEIPFNTSLKIEGQNRHTAAQNLSCDYLYLIQQSTPNPSKVTLLTQSQRKMAYLNTAATTLTDVANITGSGYLLGIRFLGYWTTASGPTVNGDIIVDGVQKMTDRPLFSPASEDIKFTEVVGPIRFSSSLRVRTRLTIAGANAICQVWYTLD